jgi:hypothetical protein
MSLAEICITAYLIVGGVAVVMIWAALVASAPRDGKARDVKYNHLGYSPFREPTTRPSRFHP